MGSRRVVYMQPKLYSSESPWFTSFVCKISLLSMLASRQPVTCGEQQNPLNKNSFKVKVLKMLKDKDIKITLQYFLFAYSVL